MSDTRRLPKRPLAQLLDDLQLIPPLSRKMVGCDVVFLRVSGLGLREAAPTTPFKQLAREALDHPMQPND